MSDAPVLELRGITKRFPGIVANDHVDFDLLPREVHALLGENGAGKTTLMNVLYGLYKPDEGELLVNGKHVSFGSAKDAIRAGIGMVHQHFMLIPVMTVAENIVLGDELNEVLQVADRITVLRRGKKVGTVPREGATEAELARMMVGRDVVLRVDKEPASPNGTLLEVRDLHVRDDRGLEKVGGVSLEVRAGEIVGLAGVDGNGQTELIEALTGLRRIESGSVVVAGTPLRDHGTPREALDGGIGHIPEDRQRRGLVLDFTLAENLVLHDYE